MRKLQSTWINIFGKKSRFWNFPNKFNRRDQPVSLLELFFDIVIMVALAGTVHELVEILRSIVNSNQFHLINCGFTVLHMMTILLIWRSFTFYSSRYGNRAMRHKFWTMLIMMFLVLSTIGAWISAEDLSGSTNNQNVVRRMLGLDQIGLIGGVGILCYLNFVIWLSIKDVYEQRALFYTWLSHLLYCVGLTINFIVVVLEKNQSSTLIWIGLVIWGLFLILWVGLEHMPFRGTIAANRAGQINGHIQERYAVLFIVFTAEMLIQVITSSVQNLSHNGESLGRIIAHLLGGFLFIFAFWWIFEYLFNIPDIKDHPNSVYFYSIAMLNIFIALIFIACGLTLLINHHHEGQGQQPSYDYGTVGRYVLFGGLLYYFICQALVHLNMRHYNRSRQIGWPKWFRLMINWSLVIYLVITIPVWFANVSNQLWMWIAISSIYIYVLCIIGMIYTFMNRNAKFIKNFQKEWATIDRKEQQWITKHIMPHLDQAHHRQHNYQVNQYSPYVAKTDKHHH